MKNKISVIIPVYNVEAYLDRCISSVVAQTHENLEIILIDDGSTDNSGARCEHWAEKDVRITVIHKENGGLSSARNVGMSRVTGDYFCFLDSDDFLAPTFCEKLLRCCKEQGCNLAMCDFWKTDGKVLTEDAEGVSVRMTKVDALTMLNLRESEEYVRMTVAWNKLYRSELLSYLRYPEGLIHEDEYVIADVLLNSNGVAWVKEPLYYYFQREESITGGRMKHSERHLDVLQAFEHRVSVLLEAGLKEYAVTAWRNQMLTYIEFLESGNYQFSGALRKKVKKDYRKACFGGKGFVPPRKLLKYAVYAMMPRVYRSIFTIRDV